MFLILFFAFLAQLGATFGIVAGVVLYTRQTRVPTGQAAMTTVDGTQVIQTASYAMTSTLSSVLPDEAFTQMRQLHVTAPTATSWVQLMVVGTARIGGSGQFGSVVMILTHAGTITLDGRNMEFQEGLSPIFEAAGFAVAPTRRRLLDVGTSLVGFFNYLATFDLDALERAAGVSQVSSATTFSGFPPTYSMNAAIYTPCDVRDGASAPALLRCSLPSAAALLRVCASNAAPVLAVRRPGNGRCQLVQQFRRRLGHRGAHRLPRHRFLQRTVNRGCRRQRRGVYIHLQLRSHARALNRC